MYSIKHRVGIKTSAEKVYQALTTDEGLSSWWTNDTTGAGDVGAIIAFRFNGGGPDFEVVELVPNTRVRWKHSGEMPEAWMPTEILFEVEEKEGQTFVNFSHSGWQEQSNFLAHCSTKWGVFMISLKEALETGKGRAFPDDIHVDHSE